MIHESDIKFPIYFMDLKTYDFYRYTDGNSVLQFNSASISFHSSPYIMNTREEFLNFILKEMKRTDLIQITKKRFDQSLDFIYNYNKNRVEPLEFPTDKQLEINRKYLLKKT